MTSSEFAVLNAVQIATKYGDQPTVHSSSHSHVLLIGMGIIAVIMAASFIGSML